jgi:hypothetical protein
MINYITIFTFVLYISILSTCRNPGIETRQNDSIQSDTAWIIAGRSEKIYKAGSDSVVFYQIISDSEQSREYRIVEGNLYYSGSKQVLAYGINFIQQSNGKLYEISPNLNYDVSSKGEVILTCNGLHYALGINQVSPIDSNSIKSLDSLVISVNGTSIALCHASLYAFPVSEIIEPNNKVEFLLSSYLPLYFNNDSARNKFFNTENKLVQSYEDIAVITIRGSLQYNEYPGDEIDCSPKGYAFVVDSVYGGKTRRQ